MGEKPTMKSTSVQSTHARLGLHPTVIIQGDVEVADDVIVGAYTVLTGPLRIESGCSIGSHCTIGGSPEHRILPQFGAITIEQGTTVRDGCVIHHGTTIQGTRIGADCYIMSRVYIAHDCEIERGVTIAAGCSLGGHVSVQRGASLGMNVSVHQHSTIGAYTMIGMSTPVAKDVPPLALVAGNPMRLKRCNQVAIDRNQLNVGEVQFGQGGLLYPEGYDELELLLQSFLSRSTRSKLYELQRSSALGSRKPR